MVDNDAIAQLTSILENDQVLYINNPETDEPYYGVKMFESTPSKKVVYVTGRVIDTEDFGYSLVAIDVFDEPDIAVSDILTDIADKGYATNWDIKSSNGGISYSVI